MKPNRRFTLVAPICLALAMLACNFGSAAPGSTEAAPAPSQGSAPAPAVNPPSGDARQALIDAFTKLDSAYPYRLTETGSGAGCAQQTRIVEFASAQEFHTKWSGCQTGEVISTGGKTYYFVNGSWTQTDVSPPGTEEQVNIADMVKAALQNVQLTGSDSLNGLNTYLYTFDLQDPVLNIQGGKVWIGAADGLPHQVQAQYTAGGITVNVQLVYEFGIPINIQAPMP